jgi:hypothetical protein
VAPYCSRRLREHGVDGLLDAFHVEHRRIRKAAGKADDAGLAEQLEQLADGGGFDVVEAGGELQGHGREAGSSEAGCRIAW